MQGDTDTTLYSWNRRKKTVDVMHAYELIKELQSQNPYNKLDVIEEHTI